MKRIRLEIGYLLAGAILLLAAGRLQSQIDTSGLQEVPREQLPKVATFYWATGNLPPLPCPPGDLDVPIYALGSNHFLIDNSGNSIISGSELAGSALLSASFPHGSGGGGDPWPPDTRRAWDKFAQQSFNLINTNWTALNDTNLYNFLLTFGDDTGTNAFLQIKKYGNNAVVIKANHFDYSAETDRDFALVVSDNVGAPILKSIDFGGVSDAQDGWLVQGIVPRFVVSDPMFMLITNIYPRQAFYKAIPYGGPEIILSGAQSYDTVSNTIVLHADISDLTGTSNSVFSLSVNGLPVPYTLGAGNNITLDTRYAVNGADTVGFKVLNHNATAYVSTNAPMDAPTVFDRTATLPLDFENETYVYFQSDNASPSIGTNFMLYGVTPPVYVRAKIIEPSSGRVIRNFAGYNPNFNLVELDWDFTDSNGTSPYTNNNYTVTFSASNSPSDVATLQLANKIERNGVRRANWAINHYEEMGSSDVPAVWFIFQSSDYLYINDELKKWQQATENMYETLYFNDFASQSQYFASQIGAARDNPTLAGIPFSMFPYKVNKSTQYGWRNFIQSCMTDADYSDFNWAGHANQWIIGGGPYPLWTAWNEVSTIITAEDINAWAKAVTTGWRMRKVAMWGCRSGRESYDSSVGGWYKAFGIYLTEQQENGLMQKNCGMFFLNDLFFLPPPPMAGGYGSSNGGAGTDIEEVTASFDQWWVMGQAPFPGGANPNYSMQFAYNMVLGTYPELGICYPTLIGYRWLPYAGVYDDELARGDKHQVVR